LNGHKADKKEIKKGAGASADKALMIAAAFAAVLMVAALFVSLPGERTEEENERPLGATFYYTDAQTGTMLYYETTSEDPKEVMVTRYNSGIDAEGHLSIPQTVEYNGAAYTVTAVYDFFRNAAPATKNLLRSVTLPETVTKTDFGAFMSCINLKEINLENVTYIGNASFDECKSLVSADTSNVTYLGQLAFVRCSSLRSLDLSSATYIGQNAVNACPELTSVTLSSDLKEVAMGAFWLSDKLGALALPYSLVQTGKIGNSAIPTTTKLVYFEGTRSIAAVANGTAINLIVDEAAVSSVSVGTKYGGSDTAVLTSAPWSFQAPGKTYYAKVTQTDPGYSEPALGPITYDPNGKLSDVTLPSGWAWADPGKRPTVDITSYLATYTPTDPTYVSVTKPIPLTVLPISYPIPDAAEKTFAYNGTLRTLMFTDFVHSAMTADGHEKRNVGDYTAVIRLIDSVNTVWDADVQEVTIAWSITPGEGKDAPDYKEPNIGTMVYDPSRTLSELTLPPGWEWVDPGTCPAVNGIGYLAKFVPEDSNYTTFSKIIEFTVTPIVYPIPDAVTKEFTYTGSPFVLTFTGFDEDTMYANGREKTDAGSYTAVIRLNDNENYRWSDGRQEVLIPWTILQADGKDAPGYEEPFIGTMEYDPSRTLSKLELPAGWEWLSPGICPGVSGIGYLAKFVPENGNYTTFSKMIEFTVTPIYCPETYAEETKFTYDGAKKTLVLIGFDGTTMTVSGHEKINAGKYTAAIRLIDTENYRWLTGVPEVTIEWSIDGGDGVSDPEYTDPEFDPMQYDPSRTLSQLTLPPRWTWMDPGICPTVKETGYLAKFTPGTENYNIVTKIIELTVTPVTYGIPEALQTLFTYSGGPFALSFTVFDEHTMTADGHVKTNAGDYTAVIRLNDNENYRWSDGREEVLIAWAIAQEDGTKAPDYVKPNVNAMTYDPSRTLSEVTLPTGWEWINPEICPTVNGIGYLAKFIPKDNNYTTFSVMVEFTVTPITVTEPEAKTISFVYNGMPRTPVLSGFDPGVMTVNGNEKTAAGDYTAVIRLIDNINYEWLNGGQEVLIAWTIAMGSGTDAPGYEEPRIGTMEYDPDRKLSDLKLPEGWEWVSPGICPTVNGTGYLAKFTPSDGNYTAFSKIIEFTVTPLPIGVPSAERTAFVYGGSPITLNLIGLDLSKMTVAGDSATATGHYTAVIRLIDTVNYRWADGSSDVAIEWYIVSGDGSEAPDYGEPGFAAMIYDRTVTLDSLTLPKGWEWHDGTMVPTVNGIGYWATFTPEDGNYNPVTKMIMLTVTPHIYGKPTADVTEFVYDGNEKQLDINGFDAISMAVTGGIGKTAGKYTAIITLTDNVNYGWTGGVYEMTIEWSVVPGAGTAAPDYAEPSFGSMVYAPTRTLNDLTLPKGWAWHDSTICPAADVTGYWATFTPEDGNYDPVTKQIMLTVEKLPLKVPTADRTSFVYTGSAITLPVTGFSGATMNIDADIRTNVGNYTAVITLKDSVNYKWMSDDETPEVTIEWSITVAGGHETPGYREPAIASMTYDPNRTLADVPLGVPGWEWKNNAITPTVNGTGYLAVFTPSDSNYAPIEVLIPVPVAPLPVDVPKASETSFKYNASERILPVGGFDGALMTIDGGAHTAVGNYAAVIRLIDTVNYMWATGITDVIIEWSITSGDVGDIPGYGVPTVPSMTYDPSRTLADVPLTDGWEWADGTITPTVNGTGYLARYTPEDPNYASVKVLIPVPVTPLPVKAPSALGTEFVYDGSEIRLQFDAFFDDSIMTVNGHAHTIVGDYTAVIRLIDTVNYMWTTEVPEVTVRWSITTADGHNTPGYTEPAISEMVYDPKRTLENVPLGIPGWTWKDRTIVPTVNGTGYLALFTPADPYYSPVEVLIPVPVTPLPVDVPKVFETMFKYNAADRILPVGGFVGETMNIIGNVHRNVGNYTAVITLKDSVNYVWTDGSAEAIIEWSITSGDAKDMPGYTEPKVPSMVYDPDRTLEDVPLGIAGWAWKDGNITPTVSGNGYLARFTPEDGNYAPVEVLIPVPVTPLPVDVPKAIETMFKYNASERTLPLTGFVPGTMDVVGNMQTAVGGYTAVITLTDSVNYVWADGSAEVMIEWSIAAGDAKDMPGYAEPKISSMTYDPRRTLADIPLGIDGWRWSDDTIVPTVNGTGYWAMFTPEDGNYAPVEKMIYVTVTQLLLPAPYADVTKYAYTGSGITLTIVGFDPMTMAVVGNVYTAVGKYTAVITLTDDVNCAWLSGGPDARIAWEIEDIEEQVHTISVISNSGGSFEYRLNGIGGFKPLTGPITAAAGTFVEIRALANDGYTFVWDGFKVSGSDIAFIVTGDKELRGTFSAIPSEASEGSSPGMMIAAASVLLLLTIAAAVFLILSRRRKDGAEASEA